MNKVNNLFAFLLFSFGRIIFRTNGRARPEKILFVNLGKIGDAVISSVVLANEEIFPKHSEIFLLLEEKSSELFKSYAGRIKILFVNKTKYRLNLFYRFRLLKSLRRLNFSEVYNLSFSRISIDDEIALLAAKGGRAYAFENNPKLKRAFARKFDARYSGILRRIPGSDVENICFLLEKITGAKPGARTKIFPAPAKLKNLPGKYFAAAPFADFKIKEWKIENFLALVKKLAEHFGFPAVILHSERNGKFNGADFALNLTGGTTLAGAAAAISNAAFFVGNDSGLLHIAKALGVKTFGIVGGGAWGRIFPYDSQDAASYFLKKLDCINCDWSCKFNDARCLNEVTAEEVFNKIITEV